MPKPKKKRRPSTASIHSEGIDIDVEIADPRAIDRLGTAIAERLADTIIASLAQLNAAGLERVSDALDATIRYRAALDATIRYRAGSQTSV